MSKRIICRTVGGRSQLARLGPQLPVFGCWTGIRTSCPSSVEVLKTRRPTRAVAQGAAVRRDQAPPVSRREKAPMAHIRADPIQNFPSGPTDLRTGVRLALDWPPSRHSAISGQAGRDAFSVPKSYRARAHARGGWCRRDQGKRPFVAGRRQAAARYHPDWRQCWLHAACSQPACVQQSACEINFVMQARTKTDPQSLPAHLRWPGAAACTISQRTGVSVHVFCNRPSPWGGPGESHRRAR